MTLCSLLDCLHVYHRFSCLVWPSGVLWPIKDICGFRKIRHFTVKKQLQILENISVYKALLRFGSYLKKKKNFAFDAPVLVGYVPGFICLFH